MRFSSETVRFGSEAVRFGSETVRFGSETVCLQQDTANRLDEFLNYSYKRVSDNFTRNFSTAADFVAVINKARGVRAVMGQG